ncbi:methyl-accepting chemotaxis protein [uncultured Roseobacter sp.]|uniref:methyl-accepting chemotaxis protein n=1 Tax=uncultured Roseobacter sp. TaxID=114847 RepID=UPI002607728C|nr:methyl-accepting chemotaxis protein [uncultured Roseobacter sp.]
MTVHQQITTPEQSRRLSEAAAAIGYEIVDIAGFLDLVEEHAKSQRSCLRVLNDRAADMTQANTDVQEAVGTMAERTGETAREVQTSAGLVRATSEKTRNVAEWVHTLAARTESVSSTITDVRTNNLQIASIATQVNTLAINAKIEAARAGDAGRGFAVVAEAINELSRQTRDAAVQISTNIEVLTGWIAELRGEAGDIAIQAVDVLENADSTDSALSRIEQSISEADRQAQRISGQTGRVENAMTDFVPALSGIGNAVESTASGIEETHERVLRLIDTSETIVQCTAMLNTSSADGPYIGQVQKLSRRIADALENAVSSGRTTMERLFDRTYRPVPGTNPEQFTTQAVDLLDELLPPIQEPALDFDSRIVFCAAVDENGYLPTHNMKFSHPPGDDPVWNTANCRNRRIFDDRVGLKAGRNREPFLLQVYRRDMGGGEFCMMKDLSAPITVNGRHWGGLRLAYTF